MNLRKGQKVIACGYRTRLVRDVTLTELAEYYGRFYGYQPITGYPVFDTPHRVAHGYAPWVHDCQPNGEHQTTRQG